MAVEKNNGTTEPPAPPELPELPDVDALLASHEAVLKEQRELYREEREREREEEQTRREQELAELRVRHEQDLETIEGLIEKGRQLMRASQWRRNPAIAEAIKVIRDHIKRVVDPKEDLLKVFYAKAIAEVNAAGSYNELGIIFERLVMQGNLITGPALDEFLEKKPARKDDIFRMNGENWIFPGTPAALIAATSQARKRAGTAYGREQEEIREKILENSVLLPSQLLERDRTGLSGLCAFETEHVFPYEPERGYKGTVVFSVESGHVTLNRVFGPLATKLRGYEGKTWGLSEKYDPVVYYVLRHAAETADGQAVRVGSFGEGKPDGSSPVGDRLEDVFLGHPDRHSKRSALKGGAKPKSEGRPKPKPPEVDKDGLVAEVADEVSPEIGSGGPAVEAIHTEGNGGSPIGELVDLATVKEAVGGRTASRRKK